MTELDRAIGALDRSQRCRLREFLLGAHLVSAEFSEVFGALVDLVDVADVREQFVLLHVGREVWPWPPDPLINS